MVAFVVAGGHALSPRDRGCWVDHVAACRAELAVGACN